MTTVAPQHQLLAMHDAQLAEWIDRAADVLDVLHYNPDHYFNDFGCSRDDPLCSACQVGALRLAVSGIQVPALYAEAQKSVDHHDPRVIACCEVLHPDHDPFDVWSPAVQEEAYGEHGDPDRTARCIGHMRNVARELRGEDDRPWYRRLADRLRPS